jgi:hypothetical protein
MRKLLSALCFIPTLGMISIAHAQVGASSAWVSDGKCYVSSWEYPTSASLKATATASVNGYSYPANVSTKNTASVTGNLSVEKVQMIQPDEDMPGVKIMPVASYTAGGEFSQTFVRTTIGTNDNSILALLFEGSASASKSEGGTISTSSTVVYEIYTLVTGESSPIPTPKRKSETKTCKAGEATVMIAGGFTAPTATQYIFPFTLKAIGSGAGTTDSGGNGASAATFKYVLPG